MTAATKKSPAKGADKKTQAKSFEILMDELEGIVGKLEGGELTLEKSVELFEKGMGLAKQGMQKLDDAEKKVEVLVRRESDR